MSYSGFVTCGGCLTAPMSVKVKYEHHSQVRGLLIAAEPLAENDSCTEHVGKKTKKVLQRTRTVKQ